MQNAVKSSRTGRLDPLTGCLARERLKSTSERLDPMRLATIWIKRCFVSLDGSPVTRSVRSLSFRSLWSIFRLTLVSSCSLVPIFVLISAICASCFHTFCSSSVILFHWFSSFCWLVFTSNYFVHNRLHGCSYDVFVIFTHQAFHPVSHH